MAEHTFEQTIRESRIFFRRGLAARLAVQMVRKSESGRNEFQNPAAHVEDFAQAVCERLWAREDRELAGTAQVPEPQDSAQPCGCDPGLRKNRVVIGYVCEQHR